MRDSPLSKPQEFRDHLVDWFNLAGKDFPWRQTRDPYAVLVAEVMLQQTQISTVLAKRYYQRFLATFPSFADLAQASDAEILKAWEGLGYYRRVRMLRATAQAVMADGGNLPSTSEALLQLPGIGRYTAGALRAFAFELPAVLVDGNVARVIARLLDFNEAIDDRAGQNQLWHWAETLADELRPWAYHAALMELGQTICRLGRPQCETCPVANFCATRHPERLPVKRQRTSTEKITEHAIWAVDPAGHWLMHHGQDSRRKGLWRLPLRDPSNLSGLNPITQTQYSITRFRVELLVYRVADLKQLTLEPDDHWIEPQQLMDLAMPTPFRRVLELLRAQAANSR